MKKTNEVSTIVNQETIALLKDAYPIEQMFTRIMLPRIDYKSQDVTEGKGKSMKVVTEAGTFFITRQTEELDEEGKKIWTSEEIGKSFKATVIYSRHQLRMYDEATEKYTSSPIYDGGDDIIPLFCDKKQVAKGTPKELKALYEYEKDGKTKSKLEDNRILYVLYKGELFQLSLRGSSMYAWLSYARNTLPPTVETEFNSEPKEKGSIEWNQMTFTTKRQLNQDEAESVLKHVGDIKTAIQAEKNFISASEKAKVDQLEAYGKEEDTGDFK